MITDRGWGERERENRCREQCNSYEDKNDTVVMRLVTKKKTTIIMTAVTKNG